MITASPQTAKVILDNWFRVEERVREAARAAGRNPGEIQIIGVSKYVDIELTEQLFQAGCSVLGENRPQNLWNKAEWFLQRNTESAALPHWHLIGHLQRNKVKRVLPHVSMLHSLDSIRLAETIEGACQELGRRLPVLIEVNVTQDSTKTGLMIDDAWRLAESVAASPGLELRGLMAMASLNASFAEIRREFSEVRQLRDRLQAELGPGHCLDQLSMGMSGDFVEAIAEGATLVRIGTSLWEGIL